MTFSITPTTLEDVKEFFPRARPWRIRALTVRIDGSIHGIGGYANLENGTRIAFLEASEQTLKEHPVILHRAAIRFFKESREEGVTRFVACSDKSREAAERWLMRLGFTPLGEAEGERIWQWRR
jgi:hypothetical protein